MSLKIQRGAIRYDLSWDIAQVTYWKYYCEDIKLEKKHMMHEHKIQNVNVCVCAAGHNSLTII